MIDTYDLPFVDFTFDSTQPEAPDPSGDAATLQNRRNQQRTAASGEIHVAWHHEPGQKRAYGVHDISENGAKISTHCYLSEGLTGLALLHRPSEIRIDRPCMIVWCKAVRDAEGRLEHYEAGIRFF
jgi:hypothetical protein